MKTALLYLDLCRNQAPILHQCEARSTIFHSNSHNFPLRVAVWQMDRDTSSAFLLRLHAGRTVSCCARELFGDSPFRIPSADTSSNRFFSAWAFAAFMRHWHGWLAQAHVHVSVPGFGIWACTRLAVPVRARRSQARSGCSVQADAVTAKLKASACRPLGSSIYGRDAPARSMTIRALVAPNSGLIHVFLLFRYPVQRRLSCRCASSSE